MVALLALCARRAMIRAIAAFSAATGTDNAVYARVPVVLNGRESPRNATPPDISHDLRQKRKPLACKEMRFGSGTLGIGGGRSRTDDLRVMNPPL